jgi:hypothetical protein
MDMNVMTTLKIAILSTGLMFAVTAAQAQKAEFGSDVSLNLGKDVKAAHASQGSLDLDDKGNVNAKAGVADGFRVGDSKFQSSVHGSVSAPAAFVAGVLD